MDVPVIQRCGELCFTAVAASIAGRAEFRSVEPIAATKASRTSGSRPVWKI